MATNNGHFSRQGQHNNKNRNRNRNRRSSSGGGSNNYSGGHGGSGGNRVLDSNGPDVKLRGTAQTIAEKYMQLGRDAQLAGDNVMAESYYQHGEHYYRLWLANQPVGQPIQFGRRPGEDEFEDEQGETTDGDDENAAVETAPEGSDSAEPVAAGEDGDANPTEAQQGKQQRPRDGGRERFRPRWPRRNDRPVDAAAQGDNPDRQPEVPQTAETDTGNWETPSFLTRPVQPLTEDGDVAVGADAVAERKPRRDARPRRPKEAEADTPPETKD
jgi:Domain of unknown function (DUF4167)